MRSLRSATATTAGLISILLIYLAFIILILVFARQIIGDLSLESRVSSYIVVPLAVVLPVFLTLVILLNIGRVVREKRSRRAGIGLKIRLMLFFTFVTLVSSIPQGVLAMSFIEIAINRWFSSPVAEGIEGGVDLVLAYNLEKLESLRTFGSSPVLADELRVVTRAPDAVWDTVSRTTSAVDSMQVFDDDLSELGFYGDPKGRMAPDSLTATAEGLLPRQIDPSGYSTIRYVKPIRTGDEEVFVVLSSVVSQEFNQKATRLSDSNDTFQQITEFRSIFRIVVIVFYSFFSVPLVLLSLLVSFLLSEEVIRPFVGLEEATRRVMGGDFSYRILERRGHELSGLVRSFNSMVSELERSRNKLLQTEKITAWQEIAQRMAHEIKNPLTPIKLSAQRILYRYRKDKGDLDRVLEPAVNAIIAEVENLNSLLQEFRDFARLPAPSLEPVNLAELVREVSEMYGRQYPLVTVDLAGIDESLELTVDRTQMKRVFSNLIVNAMDAIEETGTVSVRTDLVRKGDTEYCRIRIKDTGSGIDPSYHGQVFNPYFTTKDSGTGLGLPIVERIIFDHNGQIWFETEKNIGTTFFIDLPLGH